MGQGKGSGKDEGGGNVFVLLTILVLIVGIIAAAGMIMAVLNYNRESVTPVTVAVGSSGNGGYGDSSGKISLYHKGSGKKSRIHKLALLCYLYFASRTDSITL